jgi:hypothetical protein
LLPAEKLEKHKMHVSKLEKKFLLTLLQNAKHYHITRQENLEFLGEFDGLDLNFPAFFSVFSVFQRYQKERHLQSQKGNLKTG